jgi:uncharacterized membrane protein YGL010W
MTIFAFYWNANGKPEYYIHFVYIVIFLIDLWILLSRFILKIIYAGSTHKAYILNLTKEVFTICIISK